MARKNDMTVYQEAALSTAIYPPDLRFAYPTLGLVGEAGEVANVVKKVFRDDGGMIQKHTADKIADELGDVLWYVAVLAAEIGVDLADLAERNLIKLRSRQARGVLGGEGDER